MKRKLVEGVLLISATADYGIAGNTGTTQSDTECGAAYRIIVAERRMRLDPPTRLRDSRDYLTTTVEKLSNGNYVISVPASSTGPGERIFYNLIDPKDPEKGYTVIRVPEDGQKVLSFSKKPPLSTADILARNRQLREAEESKEKMRELIARYAQFHGFKPEDLDYAKKVVARSVPNTTPDFEIIAINYAIASRRDAVAMVLRGAKLQNHSKDYVGQLLRGELTDYSTISSDAHKMYLDTVGAIRSIRNNGFPDLADALTETVLANYGE